MASKAPRHRGQLGEVPKLSTSPHRARNKAEEKVTERLLCAGFSARKAAKAGKGFTPAEDFSLARGLSHVRAPAPACFRRHRGEPVQEQGGGSVFSLLGLQKSSGLP